MTKGKKMELTTCYNCDTVIEAEVGQVHPLCDACDDDFSAWFENQIKNFA